MEKKPNFLFLFSDQHRGDWMPYPADVKEEMGVEKLELKTAEFTADDGAGNQFYMCSVAGSNLCSCARLPGVWAKIQKLPCIFK